MYEKLDALILAAVADGRSPLYDRAVNEEAERIVQATDRDGSQIIDESLRHLRAKGLLPLARRLQEKANTETDGERGLAMCEKLDALIISAVADGRSPLYDRAVNEEAERIAEATDMDGFRIINDSLQLLRKKNLLRGTN